MVNNYSALERAIFLCRSRVTSLARKVTTVLVAETCCDTSPAASVIRPEETGYLMETNDSYVTDKGFSRGLGVRQPAEVPQSKNLDSTNSEASKRKARLLGGLAFLAGLSFGGLATAASSTVKTLAKMPQASLTLNLGPSKASPYFAAYYSPYSFLPLPLFYHSPFGPTADPPRPQESSHDDDSRPQVISVFDNRQPDDFTANNEQYSDELKNPGNDKSAAGDGEDGAERRSELRADRNAEEKVRI